MTKFKNISAGDIIVAKDAGRSKTNGDPYTWWVTVKSNEIVDVVGDAIRGASCNPNLRMITEEKVEAPVIQVKTEEAPKKRGRPKLIN